MVSSDRMKSVFCLRRVPLNSHCRLKVAIDQSTLKITKINQLNTILTYTGIRNTWVLPYYILQLNIWVPGYWALDNRHPQASINQAKWSRYCKASIELPFPEHPPAPTHSTYYRESPSSNMSFFSFPWPISLSPTQEFTRSLVHSCDNYTRCLPAFTSFRVLANYSHCFVIP